MPVGNDDEGVVEGAGKQFVTIVTKAGNYFYLIINRDDEGEQTVHFLNQVDEADLLALMEDEEAQKYITVTEEPTTEPEPEPEIGEPAEGEPVEEKKKAEQAKPDPDADYVEDEDYGYDESEDYDSDNEIEVEEIEDDDTDELV